MSLGLEGAFGADAVSKLLREKILEQERRKQQEFQNSLALRGADRADRSLSQQDELMRLQLQDRIDSKALTEADKANEAVPAGTVFPSVDRRIAPTPLLGRLQMVGALQPTSGSLGSTTDTPANAATGTPPQGRLVAMPEGLTKLPTARQSDVLADNARAEAALQRQLANDQTTQAHQQEVLVLQTQNAADRLSYQNQLLQLQRDKMAAAADAKANKPLVLSAGGKSAKSAIEQAGPLTDQVLAMMEKEFPGIEKQDGRYNTTLDKLGSLYQKGKYLLGFNDENDPRRQIVNLLQPIQAGQYTRSSRSYKMVELALKHMADMSQTPEAQYARAKELRAVMPEMLEGVVRGEQPVDPANPLAGSYFDPARQATPAAAPDAPKVERWVRRGGRLVRE